MAEKIYYCCNSKEINTVANIVIEELNRGDYMEDFILSKIWTTKLLNLKWTNC
ncbi:hypothetical protein [Marinifilum sp.]|uniref:hypothetical protein n=1 Tax=Marinifilum sp. TaxID=2033137 RepID=UPI003BAB10B5